MIELYRLGDWVVCNNDPQKIRSTIGRVAEDLGDAIKICSGFDCRTKTFVKEGVHRASAAEISFAKRGLGYNRFNAECPRQDLSKDECKQCFKERCVFWNLPQE